MKKQKFKGLWVVITTAIVLLLLMYNRGGDKYSRQFSMSDFRQTYIKGYSGESTALHYYYPESYDTVKLLTKGPVSLKAATYKLEVQYAGSDDSTVLKIFASDYISANNSGGKIFVQEKLNPADSAIRISFELDQPVDSLFITFETLDNHLTIGRVNLNSNRYIYTDTYIFMAMAILSCRVMLYLINTSRKLTNGFTLGEEYIPAKNTALLFVAVMAIAVFIASLPILDGGIILGHDTRFHLNRIEGIARGLQSGQFPVRIHGGTLNDYGYPNSLFYPELLLYIPAIFTVIGVSVYNAFKIYIVFINRLTIIIAYVSFKTLTKNRYLGLSMAIVYLLLPYRILCAYWRSAVGEFTAMTFLPLVVYGLYAIIYDNKKDWPYLVIGASGVLQSHILTTEMTALFALVFVLGGIKNLFTAEKRYISLILATITTVLVNIWFLGPMVLMMLQLGLIVFDRAALTSAFATYNISNLFNINKILIAGPYSIGILLLFAVGGYIVYRIIYNHKQHKYFSICDNMLAMFFAFSVMSTAIFPWGFVEKIPIIGSVVSAIQFPTRMLTIVQICGIVIMAFFIEMSLKNSSYKRIACVCIACFTVFMHLNFIEFTIIGENRERITSKNHFENNIDNLHSVGQAEYLVAGNDVDAMIANLPVIEFDNNDVTVTNYSHYGTKLSFDYTIENGQSATAIIPVTYIPNYEVLINGQKVQPAKNSDARVKFELPVNSGTVEVQYKSPLTFRVFELISLISVVLFVFQKKILNIIPVKK